MSVGDIKGFRRRLNILRAKGHAPVKAGRSVGEMIEHNRVKSARMAAAKGKSK